MLLVNHMHCLVDYCLSPPSDYKLQGDVDHLYCALQYLYPVSSTVPTEEAQLTFEKGRERGKKEGR